jgi:hypothetical protein
MCPARAARTRWRGDETSSDQILERILAIDGGQPRDRLAAARDHDLGTLRDVLEMLAQPIVELTHSNLIPLTM